MVKMGKSKAGRSRLVVLWMCGMMTVSMVFVSLQQNFPERVNDTELDLPYFSVDSDHHQLERSEWKDAVTVVQTDKSEAREQAKEKSKLKVQKNKDSSPQTKPTKKKLKVQKDKDSTPQTKLTKKKKPRPPLNTLITDDDRGVVGHVSFLLDWAIIGHAKTATSFIMKWLSKHPEIRTWEHEVCDLYDNKPAGLVKRLYEELPEGNYKRGFKCPGHFSRRSIRYFKKYFSKTRVIVGLRHPVRWFESFYNFRMRHGGANYSLPEPNKLIGECTPETDGICTDRANFHTNLAVFGKTNLSDPSEQNLLRFRKYTYGSTYPIDNPIFLYDVAQFYDTNTPRTELFKTDLQVFLGLKAPMPEPNSVDAGISSRPKQKSIDICSKEFDDVRKELLVIGKRASIWIRKYLLESDQVFVSSREHFMNILKEWEDDPCNGSLEYGGEVTKA
jgi:hypothetical protein